MVLPVIDEFGHETNTYASTQSINIGDVVEVTNFGDVYPTYKDAFKMLWNDHFDSFHDKDGRQMLGYVDYVEYYGNRWVVKNMCVHAKSSCLVLLHLKDRLGRNLLIELRGVKKIKECSPKVLQPRTIRKVKNTV